MGKKVEFKQKKPIKKKLYKGYKYYAKQAGDELLTGLNKKKAEKNKTAAKQLGPRLKKIAKYKGRSIYDGKSKETSKRLYNSSKNKLKDLHKKRTKLKSFKGKYKPAVFGKRLNSLNNQITNRRLLG